MSEVRVKVKVTLRRGGEEDLELEVRDRYRAVGRVSTPPTLAKAHTEMSVFISDRIINGLFMGMASFKVWLWATLGCLFGYIG